MSRIIAIKMINLAKVTVFGFKEAENFVGKEEMLVTSIFFFSNNVSPSRMCKGRENSDFCH